MMNYVDAAMKLPGLVVAPLTPFTADLKVDGERLRRQIDFVVDDSRATMVVAAGVETQEYTYLGFDERKTLIRDTMACVNGRVPVMVGVSHPSFRTVIDLAQFAEGEGAAAIQLLAPLRPFAGAPTRDDLVAYFEAVARETSLPMTLKDSSRDLARVSRLIVEIDRAGHARYFATMQMLLASLMLGGSGATMPPPASSIARAIIDAFLAKDYERAARYQLQFALFPSKWMHRGLAPVMKAAMEIIGLPMGDPYPPYAPLTQEERSSLAVCLKETVLGEKLSARAAE
jgi:4-hydroxy-tetrahydrodipicolinate synthase